MSNNKELKLYTAYDNLMDQYAEQFDKLFRDNDSEQTFPIGEWISRDRRGVYEINDYYISYDDMRTCVDNGLSFDEFDQWYQYRMRLIQIDTAIKTPTLEEWIQGYITVYWKSNKNNEIVIKTTTLSGLSKN